MSARTATRPTAFGFTIRLGHAGRLWVRHDASGYTCPLAEFIAAHANAQELVACGRACDRAFARTGEVRYAAAHRACQRRWAALRAG